MSPLWVPSSAAVHTKPRRPDRVDLISADMDDGGWRDEPEFSDEFEPALWVILEANDISFDPTLTKEEAQKTVDMGVLSARFAGWQIHVNWSTQWAQKIPPHHMAVEWDGIEQGIISPYLLVRTCWSCGRGCPRGPDGSWDDDRYWLCANQEQLNRGLPERWPAVMPGHKCPGQREWSSLLRGYRHHPCEQFDWFGTTPREMFQRDAAAEYAVKSNDPSMFDKMTIQHVLDAPEGKPKTRRIRTD